MTETTAEQWDSLADRLAGTCESIGTAMDYLEIDDDPDEAEEEMLNRNVEICPGCEWWVDSYELADMDECENCAEPGPEYP